jgi:predicted chitinase
MAGEVVTVSSSQALSALFLCGGMGLIGQAIRAVVGLKNAGALNSTTPSAQSEFSLAYFGLSLMIGFIAGMLAGLGVGLDSFLKFDPSNLKPLLGLAAAGYAGADFIENSMSLVLPGTPKPDKDAAADPPPKVKPVLEDAQRFMGAPNPPPVPDDGSAALSAAMGIVCPRVNKGIWIPALTTAFAQFGLASNRRRAAAVGQFLVEAGAALQQIVESLDYSAERASEIFPTVFPTPADAVPYVGHPEAFGNRVYANKLGNGDEATGDGFRFRGRGLIQLTGRDTYAAFGKSVGKTAEDAARYCETVEGAAVSGCWYLANKGCLPLADRWDLDAITVRVNGAARIGGAQRIAYSNDMLKHLGG